MQLNLNLDLEDDVAIIEELETMPAQERGQRVLQWARLGRFVMSMAKVTPSKDALRDYFSELSKEMDELQDTIEKHRGLFQALSVGQLGQLGESFVQNRLTEAYGQRGDTFKVWSSTGHQGDVIGNISRQDKPALKVLVEVKDYPKSPQVPTAEVDKFRNDIKSNPDMAAGLFISINNSKIAAMGGKPFYAELVDGRPVFYVAQESAQQEMFIVAWGMICALFDAGGAKVSDGFKALSQQAAARLRELVDGFMSEVSSDTARLDEITRSATDIQNATMKIFRSAESLKAELQARAKALGQQIEREADALDVGEPSARSIFCTEQIWLSKWADIGATLEGNGHRANLELLLKWLNQLDGITPDWSEKGVDLHHHGEPKLSIRLNKTNLQFLYSTELVEQAKLMESLELKETRDGWRLDCKNGAKPTIQLANIGVLEG